MATSLYGNWYSSVGSQLVLQAGSASGELTGTFDSTQDPGPAMPLYGSASVTNDSYCPVAFSVSWPASSSYPPSVTSYTGQYSNVNGNEKIEVIFLLANQVESTVLWQSVSISSEVFTRTPP